jgi:hypothetical protein
MKKLFRNSIAILCASLLIFSCDKDEDNPGDTPSDKKYYFIADVGSDQYKYESNTGVECYTFEMRTCAPFYEGFDNIGNLEFADFTVDSVRAAYLMQMKGKTYANNNASRYFSLWLEHDGEFYTTDNLEADERTGSVTITDVVADGVTSTTDAFDNPYKCFKITGTFTGNLASGDDTQIELTNGKFSMRFNESER